MPTDIIRDSFDGKTYQVGDIVFIKDSGLTRDATIGGKMKYGDYYLSFLEKHQAGDQVIWRTMVVKNSDEGLPAIIVDQVKAGRLTNAQAQKFVTKDGYPKPITIKLIQPGLMPYEYMNNGQGAMVYVAKEALDKMMLDPEKSLVGKPVINEAHRKVSPSDYQNGRADGTVTKVWWDPNEGWYKCEALVWDEDTRNNLAGGYGVSCEYTGTAWGPGGTDHLIPYDREVLDGIYRHLAVVQSPRYEDARVSNSNTGGKLMKLFQWLKKDGAEVRNSVEVDTSKTAIEVDGKEYSLENAVAALKDQEAKKAADEKARLEADALKNARKLKEGDSIEIDGKEYKAADLINAMKAKMKNDKEDEYKKDHKDGDHDGKTFENCPMCNEADDDADEKKKKEKEDDEKMKNAEIVRQHTMGRHSVAENTQCEVCNALANARLANARMQKAGNLERPTVPSVSDGLRRGKELMGKTARQQQEELAAAKK